MNQYLSNHQIFNIFSVSDRGLRLEWIHNYNARFNHQKHFQAKNSTSDLKKKSVSRQPGFDIRIQADRFQLSNLNSETFEKLKANVKWMQNSIIQDEEYTIHLEKDQ